MRVSKTTYGFNRDIKSLKTTVGLKAESADHYCSSASARRRPLARCCNCNSLKPTLAYVIALSYCKRNVITPSPNGKLLKFRIAPNVVECVKRCELSSRVPNGARRGAR